MTTNQDRHKSFYSIPRWCRYPADADPIDFDAHVLRRINRDAA